MTLICLRLIYNMTTTSRLLKHSWMKKEEAGLVELVNAGGWRFDNRTFHLGYLNQLVRMMAFKILSCNVHASTIESNKIVEENVPCNWGDAWPNLQWFWVE